MVEAFDFLEDLQRASLVLPKRPLTVSHGRAQTDVLHNFWGLTKELRGEYFWSTLPYVDQTSR